MRHSEVCLSFPIPYHPPFSPIQGQPMLQKMRKYTKSWISSLFLGLLALSFGVWGIADIFRGNSDTSVASVGSEKIPVELFQRDYRNVTRAASRQGPLKPAQAKAAGQQVLD